MNLGAVGTLKKTFNLPIDYRTLSPSDRRAVREQYIAQQNGECCHCGMPLSGVPCNSIEATWIDIRLFPKGFFNWPIHLHHCHDTGMTIGAVHARCNAVLWQYHGE